MKLIERQIVALYDAGFQPKDIAKKVNKTIQFVMAVIGKY